jgi:predicted dienelactone hydrolase
MQHRNGSVLLLVAITATVLSGSGCGDAEPATADTGLPDAGEEVTATKTDTLACRDPQESGPYEVVRETWQPADPNRDGVLDALVWRPVVPASEEAPWAAPLVVISHGMLMEPSVYEVTAHRLASHGAVVVGTKHVDNGERVVGIVEEQCADSPTFDQIDELFGALFEPDHALLRPADVTALIDAMALRAEAGGDLHSLLDLERVAVVGHSFGGFTALSVGGATLDAEHIVEVCGQERSVFDLLSDSLGYLTCALLETTDPARLEGDVSLRDARVDAVAILAAPLETVWGAGYEGLGALDIPSLFVYTDTDEAVDYASFDAALPSVAGDPVVVTLRGGNHGNFGTVDLEVWAEQTGRVPDSCIYASFVKSFAGDPEAELDLAPEMQADLTASVVTAFVANEFVGGSDCAANVTPEAFISLGPDKVVAGVLAD